MTSYILSILTRVDTYDGHYVLTGASSGLGKSILHSITKTGLCDCTGT